MSKVFRPYEPEQIMLMPAMVYAYRHHSSSFDLAPANGLTITVHLAVGLFLTLAYVWTGAGQEGLGYVVPLALLFLGFVGYMYWHVERPRRAFLGLKQVMK